MQQIIQRFSSVAYGFTLPLTAGRLILQNRGLMLLSLIPICVTLVLYIFLVGALKDWAHGILASYFSDWGWDAEGWLAWMVTAFTNLLLLLVGALTFTFSSSIVASPFNDALAERAERFAAPALPAVADTSLKRQAVLILIDLAKTIGATIAGIAALILSWIPIVNIAAFLVAFLLVCFQYTSYPQTRRGIGFAEGFRFLFRHIWACAGFGSAVTILFAIPFFASFILPLAVVGGTLLVARAPGSPSLPRLR